VLLLQLEHRRTAEDNVAPIMSSALSKRQQARNEKALQDLLQSVAGNNFCADCQGRNPGNWPSWHPMNLRGMGRLTKPYCQVGHRGAYAFPFEPPTRIRTARLPCSCMRSDEC
jgi:hypothetical protein